jgi:hypothetical protein
VNGTGMPDFANRFCCVSKEKEEKNEADYAD